MNKKLIEIFKNNIVIILIIIISNLKLISQTTTGGIRGFVKDGGNSNIELINTATNEKINITPQSNGFFSYFNLTPSSDYVLKITANGKELFNSSVTIPLGDNLDLGNIVEKEEIKSSTLETVSIVGENKNSAFSKNKISGSTVISKSLLQEMPAGNRGIADFVRFTPQANGTSFAGSSNRFNNLTVDGAQNNDVFGLASGTNLPGGNAGTQPISLDAIQEMQVVLSPYNVTLGNFAGGGINAVTRSGSNKMEGSVYSFYKDNNLQGKNPLDGTPSDKYYDLTIGARLGGSIIKNKLFYFISFESVNKSTPTTYNAGDANSISIDVAKSVKDFFKNTYNYDVGSYDQINRQTSNQKLLVKLDYILNNKHKISLRHNFINAYNDILSRSSTSFSFQNSGYAFTNVTNSTVLELKSNLSNKMFNSLILGFTNLSDLRSYKGDLFPNIKFNGSQSIILGSEAASNRNILNQNILELTNNFKLILNKHTLTIGTHNELFLVENSFANGLHGRWELPNTVNLSALTKANFEGSSNVISRFSSSYPLQDGGEVSKPNIAQLGFYAQDEFDIIPRLNLTIGLRLDVPYFLNSPVANPEFKAQYGYSTDQTPSGNLLWSPRLGFKYQATDNNSIQIRGGAGIFTGRVPFVWLSNNYGNDGVRLGSVDASNAANVKSQINNGNGFNPNPSVTTVSALSTGVKSYGVNVVDKDFKFPQMFRANLAFDFKLPGGIEFTIEGIFNKTLNNVYYQRLDLVYNADGSIKTTKTALPIPSDNVSNLIDKVATSNTYKNQNGTTNTTKTYGGGIYLLKNTNEGFSYSISAIASKKIDLAEFGNLAINAAYTYGQSKDVNSGLSSIAASNFSNNILQGNVNFNNPPLSFSSYDLRHRIIFGLNYKIKYLDKAMATTVSVFYSGNSGQPVNYIYSTDLNGDGGNINDLIYVPTDVEVDKKTTLTATQKQDIKDFINSSEVLSEIKGKYLERNVMKTPWEHIVDIRLLQDFNFKIGNKINTLQLSFEIFNVGNLLNKEWGRKYTTDAMYGVRVFNGATGELQKTGTTLYNHTNALTLDITSRYQMQVGVRYIF